MYQCPSCCERSISIVYASVGQVTCPVCDVCLVRRGSWVDMLPMVGMLAPLWLIEPANAAEYLLMWLKSASGLLLGTVLYLANLSYRKGATDDEQAQSRFVKRMWALVRAKQGLPSDGRHGLDRFRWRGP